MSLKYSILTIVYRAPTTGYDLLKSFDGSVGFFWKTTYPQIYRELDALEKINWIEGVVQKQESRPDKKIFSITELGKEELKKWCLQEIQFKPKSDEFLLKLFSGALIGKKAVNKHLEDNIQYAKTQLQLLIEIKNSYFKDEEKTLASQYAYNYISLLIGIKSYENEIKMYKNIQGTVQKISES